MSIDDLIDFTPELRAEAVKLVSELRSGRCTRQPSSARADGPLGTLVMPSEQRRPQLARRWRDPQTGILYIYSFTQVTARGLVHDPERSDMEHILGTATAPGAGGATGGRAVREVEPRCRPCGGRAGAGEGRHWGRRGGGGRGLTVQALSSPPWGRISAIDLGKGRSSGRSPARDAADAVRNHPALKGLTTPRTGRSNGRIGTLVTKTLRDRGRAGFFHDAGRRARCDAPCATAQPGRRWVRPYVGPQTGSPMTVYALNGQQVSRDRDEQRDLPASSRRSAAIGSISPR